MIQLFGLSDEDKEKRIKEILESATLSPEQIRGTNILVWYPLQELREQQIIEIRI